MEWQLQEAKNKFSQLVEHALHEGPQFVTRHGKPAVVVLSTEEYEKTLARPEKNFVEFLLSMPKLPDDDEDLFVRIDTPPREGEI